MSNIKIEKQWKTKQGYYATVLLYNPDRCYERRCGYVGIPKEHPLYGIDYHQQADCIKQEQVDSVKIRDKSLILMLTATCSSDKEFETIRRSPDILIDCHGGLTYSRDRIHSVDIPDTWWFGFDCGHYGDSLDKCSVAFCTEQCESISEQLANIKQGK